MNKAYLFSCAALLLSACTQTAKEYKLEGTLTGFRGDYVLVSFGANSVSKADTVRIHPDGTFSYAKVMESPQMGYMYVPDKAFYSLIMINGTTTQLKANPDNMNDYTFTGDLEDAYKFNEAVSKSLQEKCGNTYGSFADMQRELTALADSVKKTARDIRPKEFANLMNHTCNEIIDYTMLNYHEQLAANGKAPNSDASYNKYMESLELDEISKAQVFLRWKESCLNPDGTLSYLRMITTAEEKIKDAELLERTVLDLLTSYFNSCDAELEAVYQKSMELVKTEKYREWMNKVYNANKNLIPGAEAMNCTLETMDGKTINLSDLFGKILYLDIWATWCGPCCEEIPYMEKVAEHFKGDIRIVPISISVDSNKEAWRKKLKADNPQWAQYLCKDFTELYGITGIPRFLLIGKDGKIITTDAPRPSDPKCIEFINRQLIAR